MGLRIPQNQVVQSKYTAGKEYIIESTYREYQGYYYEFNGKIFAGKELNVDAPILLPIPKNNNNIGINSLLTSAATYIYGKISKNKLTNNKPSSHVYQYNSEIRYFSYQTINKLIKEVNEETFNTFKSNPLYKVISLSFKKDFDPKELDDAEKTIPGIKEFLKNF
jgi:hypothetical protein